MFEGLNVKVEILKKCYPNLRFTFSDSTEVFKILCKMTFFSFSSRFTPLLILIRPILMKLKVFAFFKTIWLSLFYIISLLSILDNTFPFCSSLFLLLITHSSLIFFLISVYFLNIFLSFLIIYFLLF